MNKLINWTFGSFFRTLGRFLFYILLGLLLSYLLKDVKLPKIDLFQILDVYASENSYNLYTFDEQTYTDMPMDFINQNTQFYSSTGYNSFNRLNVYNCTSSSSCTGTISPYYTTGGVMFNHTMVNYGFDFAQDTNIAIADNHLISYQYTFCSEDYISNISNRIYVNTGIGSGRSNQVSLLRTDYYSLGNITWYDYLIGFQSSNCYTVYNLFISPASSSLTLKTNLTSSQYTQKYINLIAYKIEDLGATDYLTSSQLNSAISNSGLATANSVNQVQQSVNQVQQEIDGVNDSIQEQIDADAQNTQDIIDNQNANNQAQIDSQKVCTYYDKSNILINNKYLNGNGIETSDNVWGITDYIKIKDSDITYTPYPSATGAHGCYYDLNKNKISCFQEGVSSLTIPNNAYYIRASINKNNNLPTMKICVNGNQAMQDTMTNDDSSGASSEASSFFDNFTTNTHGLTGIITAPLNAINSLTSQSCTPLVLPLPFVNQNLTLPCMRPIYEEHFSGFMQIYDIITLGIISYWVMVRIFSLVKDFKNPEHDEVEVLDL